MTSPIVGARTLKPLEDNLGTLDVTFTADQRRRLDDISTFELGFPHHMLSRPMTRAVMFGDVKIQPRA